MTIKIRSGWLADKFALESIGENALGLFGEHNCGVVIPDQALEGHEDYHLRVAVDGQKKVGYFMAQTFGYDLYLRQMFVLAEANHTGVGSLLMKDLLAYAKENKFSSVSLLTSANAPWAVPFYQKFGFEIPDETVLPQHIRENLLAAANTESIQSVPGYLPLAAMSRKIDDSLDL
jgi:GNAT superfamily N-acetyltransferase